jgi:hypothetical protein
VGRISLGRRPDGTRIRRKVTGRSKTEVRDKLKKLQTETDATGAAELEQLTGEPVRSEYRTPGTGTPIPPADAVLACPLTFNSVNKFAHGHADNFAAGLLCEMAGYGVPVVVVPHCKPQLASHPAFTASLQTLRGMGVRVLFDPDAPYERRLPPWREVIDAPAQVNTVPVNGTRANPARFECGVDAGEIYPVRNLPGAQVFTLGRQEGQPRPPDLLTDTYGLCRCRARRDSNPQPSDP